MIRSVKARIELAVDQALARLRGLQVSTDQAADKMKQAQDAADRAGMAFEEAGRRGRRGMEEATRWTVGAIDAIERLRYRLLIAGGAMTAFTGFAVKAAMNAEATMAQTDVLFRQNADEVRAWARDFGAAMGYGQSAVLGFANQVQTMLLSMGLAEGQAWKIGQRLIRIANDVAVASRKPVSEVLQAMNMAMMGQTRSLRSLGVVLQKADLEQRARAMGFRKAFDELTDYQKALVATTAIEKAAAHLTEYAADHLDLAAVQTRRLKEAFGELREELGNVWMKTWGDSAGKLADFFSAIKDNKPLVTLLSIFVGVGGAVFTAMGQLGMFIFTLNQLTRGRAGEVLGRMLVAPFRFLKDAIMGTGRLLVDGLSGWGRIIGHTFQQLGRRALDAAADVLRAGADMVATAVSTAVSWAKSMAIKVGTWMAEKAHLAALTVQNWLYAASVEGSFLAHVKARVAAIAHTVTMGAYAAATKIATVAQWAFNAAVYANPITIIAAAIIAAIAALGALAYAIYRVVQRLGGFRAVLNLIAGAFRSFWSWLKSIGIAIWEFFKQVAGFFVKAYDAVRDFVLAIPEMVASFGRRVRDALVGAFQASLNWLHVWANRVIRVVLGIADTLLGWVPWLGGRIKEAMRSFDPLQEMIRGMRAKTPELAAEVERVANMIRDRRPDLHGKALLEEFEEEFRKARPDLASAVDEYIAEMRRKLESQSPPKEGPLRRIREWGANLGREFAEGFAAARTAAIRPQVQALGAAIQGAAKVPAEARRAATVVREWTPVVEAKLGPVRPGILPQEAGGTGGLLALLGGLARPPASPRVVERASRAIEVHVHVGGVTVNVPPGAPLEAARAAGRLAGDELTRTVKEGIARYLLEVLGANETLRMPDEVE